MTKNIVETIKILTIWVHYEFDWILFSLFFLLLLWPHTDVCSLSFAFVVAVDGWLFLFCSHRNYHFNIVWVIRCQSELILISFHTGSPYVRAISPIRAVAGDSFTMNCPFSGYPIDSIRWLKSGQELVSSKSLFCVPYNSFALNFCYCTFANWGGGGGGGGQEQRRQHFLFVAGINWNERKDSKNIKDDAVKLRVFSSHFRHRTQVLIKWYSGFPNRLVYDNVGKLFIHIQMVFRCIFLGIHFPSV